jgi:two-component system chemotaxis response regulator CheY
MTDVQYDNVSSLAPATTRSILVVEDDPDVGYTLAQTLKSETPHKVLFATDGFQALKMVPALRPDLLVVDYHLPKLNGVELIRHLRAMPGFEHTPVLLISAALPQLTERDEYVIPLDKPFDIDVFLHHIELAL